MKDVVGGCPPPAGMVSFSTVALLAEVVQSAAELKHELAASTAPTAFRLLQVRMWHLYSWGGPAFASTSGPKAGCDREGICGSRPLVTD